MRRNAIAFTLSKRDVDGLLPRTWKRYLILERMRPLYSDGSSPEAKYSQNLCSIPNLFEAVLARDLMWYFGERSEEKVTLRRLRVEERASCVYVKKRGKSSGRLERVDRWCNCVLEALKITSFSLPQSEMKNWSEVRRATASSYNSPSYCWDWRLTNRIK